MEAGRSFQILAGRSDIYISRYTADANDRYAVYRPRRYADPYAASRFDSKKARGELVLEHTLRNISYRIPKGRQPCHDVPNSDVFYWLGDAIHRIQDIKLIIGRAIP
ncbi:jg18676 [Pararge aegeria aegeria]|uniref:Jg18676 protein n=1 Tax=Pararge aegeria aegeria TaxID=348720 RepID=A0A8S4QG49_9NEOP|nr:jg18676 [Pararge aegeria aegeria]